MLPLQTSTQAWLVTYFVLPIVTAGTCPRATNSRSHSLAAATQVRWISATTDRSAGSASFGTLGTITSSPESTHLPNWLTANGKSSSGRGCRKASAIAFCGPGHVGTDRKYVRLQIGEV